MPVMMKVQLVMKMLRKILEKVLRLLDKVKIWLWLMRCSKELTGGLCYATW